MTTPRLPCPGCDGQRDSRSTLCDPCYRARRRQLAKGTRPPHPPTRPCIDCGVLGHSRRERCRDCFFTHIAIPDVDEMAVERLKAGRAVKSNAWERREAANELRAKGISVVEIAARLRVSTRSVERYKRAA